MPKKPPDLDTNPIYQRLTRNSGWPDEKAVIWLVVATVGAGLLFDLTALLVMPGCLIGTVICLGWISILLTPAILAVMAVSIVTNDLQKEDFQMMKLTLATDKSLLHGYTFATLHRLRILTISTRSLIPALIALVFIVLLQAGLPDLSVIGSVIITAVGTLVFVMATRQFNELGAALGVTLAIWWQRPILAAVGALLIMLTMTPIPLCILGYILITIAFIFL